MAGADVFRGRGRHPHAIGGRGFRRRRGLARVRANAVRRSGTVPGIHRQRLRPSPAGAAAEHRTEHLPARADDRGGRGHPGLQPGLLAPQYRGHAAGMNPSAWYDSRLSHWTGTRDTAARAVVFLSRLRLASFLTGVALLWWGLESSSEAIGRVAPLSGLTLLVGFGILVVRHARQYDIVERA